ncbi:proteasome subunit alpha, partial [Natronorubrum bangense JCM 10635]
LEDNYDEESDLDGGIALALDALASVNDGSLLPSEVGLATVDVETESFEQFDHDKIESHLEENDLLDTGEDDETDE